jgi:hypothetical protein
VVCSAITDLRAGCAAHSVEWPFYLHLQNSVPLASQTPAVWCFVLITVNFISMAAPGSLLQAVPDALKLSREYALLGKYDTAAVYFDGAVAAIQQYVAPALVAARLLAARSS